MKEVLPGIWHWTALNESIGGKEVSSYYLASERVVIDPMLPAERPDWFQPEHALPPPREVVERRRAHPADADDDGVVPVGHAGTAVRDSRAARVASASTPIVSGSMTTA